MIAEKISYTKVRDFGQVFGASFGYIKQNIKSLYGSIILYTLPPLSIIAFLLIFLIKNSEIFNFGNISGNGIIAAVLVFLSMIMLVLLIIHCSFLTIVNKHLVDNENLGKEQYVTITQVRTGFFKSFWPVFGNTFLLVVLSLIFGTILAIIFSLFGLLVSTGGVLGGILLMLFVMFYYVIVTPMLTYIFIAIYFVMLKDKVGIITALSKVFKSLKGHFWSTWLVSFLGFIMCYLASGILSIPIIIFAIFTIATRVKDYTNTYSEAPDTGIITYIIGAILFIVTLLLVFMIYSVLILLCNFQYASIEEKKTGTTINELINSI